MHPQRKPMFLLSLAVLCGGYLVPQPAATAADDPVALLGFYVGHWATTGRMRAAPDGPFVPLSGHETCKWLKGRRAVQCDETIDSKAGSSVASYILGYDAIARHYVVFGIDDGGNILNGDGRLDGERWTWAVRVNDGTSMSKWRYVFRPGPHGARTMQVSLATSDTAWARMQEVTYTRKDKMGSE